MTTSATVDDFIRRAARALRERGVEAPQREGRLLVCEALSVDASEAIAGGDASLEGAALDRCEALLERRLSGEPLSRIRGWREFYGRRFRISPDVLDPRADTEALVAVALDMAPPGGRVLDLGCGSGCILGSLLAERPDLSGVGVDISAAALAIARHNLERLGVDGRARLVEGDFRVLPAAESGRGPAGFDIVVSNPPYIASAQIGELEAGVREHDPLIALDGGEDGLDAYRSIIARAGDWLGVSGALILEVGFGQAADVLRLAEAAHLAFVRVESDLSGVERVVAVRLTKRGAGVPGRANSLG
jgi:release factor glutamine methyltransferase